MKRVTAYKLAKTTGFDFYTGKTINYRENIGKVVMCPNPNPKLGVCSRGVIHASKNPNDCFVGASIPCSAFRVEGKPECGDAKKWGFTELAILEEIMDLDKLFGWKYSEALKPIHPLKGKPKKHIAKQHIQSLKEWASAGPSVRASVGASVGDSVGASVGPSAGASVRASIWASVGDSVGASVGPSAGASVGASIWASVGDSVGASVGAYIGSLFPEIKNWKYIKHNAGEYPYRGVVELWKQGLIPSFDGRLWRLHSGKDATIVFEISKDELREVK